MNSEFLAEAREELIEAALYYDSKELGLGTRFRNEVAKVGARYPKRGAAAGRE